MEEAVRDVVEQLGQRGEADLALVFVSTIYASDLTRLLPLLSAQISAKHWIGCPVAVWWAPRRRKRRGNGADPGSQRQTLLTLPGADHRLNT